MAWVEVRITKPGNAIILKSRHVLSPRRVLAAIIHHRSLLNDHAHWGSAYGYSGRGYDPAAGSAEVLTPSSPSHGYVPALYSG